MHGWGRGALRHPRVFDLGARVYDALTDNALWREHAARLLEPFEGAPGAPPAPARVLDLGCGPGASAFAVAEALAATVPASAPPAPPSGPGAAPSAGLRVVGVDLSAAMLARAATHRRARWPAAPVAFARADAQRLPFADASFDLVTGHSVLYLLPDPDRALAEARRVLRPGGGLVLVEPRRRGSLREAARQALPAAPHEVLRRPAHALRLALSMCAWRVYSASVGRLDPDLACARLRAAGFARAEARPTLGGLGLTLVGRT